MGTTFLAQLVGGCLLMTAACRPDHVASSYVRLMQKVAMALLFVLIVGILLTPNFSTNVVLAGVAQLALGAGVLTFAAHAASSANRWTRARSPATARAIMLIAAGVMLGAATISAAGGAMAPRPSHWIVIAGNAGLAALIVGGVSAAMLLGHAYLTQTSMPIDPLRRMTRLLGAALLARFVWAGVGLYAARRVLSEPPRDETWLYLLLTVRVGVGLIGLSILTYMITDCVRRRSTQSATGILYIAMIFAYFGELAALDLARSFGLWV